MPDGSRVGMIIIGNCNRWSSNHNHHFQMQCNCYRLHCKCNRNQRLLSRLHKIIYHIISGQNIYAVLFLSSIWSALLNIISASVYQEQFPFWFLNFVIFPVLVRVYNNFTYQINKSTSRTVHCFYLIVISLLNI